VLPGEYRAAVTAALPRLSAQTLPALVALAELPDMVRGYEEVKLANVARFRTALAEAVRELS
jgi:indolepyruvate ferredoxin oxidoreductase